MEVYQWFNSEGIYIVSQYPKRQLIKLFDPGNLSIWLNCISVLFSTFPLYLFSKSYYILSLYLENSNFFFFFFTWSCKMKKNAHTFICFFFHSWPRYLEWHWNSDTADSWVGIFWNNYKVMYAHLVNSLCFYTATKVLSQDSTAFLREQQSSQFPQQASPSAVRRSRTQQECVLRDVCGKSSQQI